MPDSARPEHPEPTPYAPRPRWVTWLGIAGVVALVVFVVVLLAGGHGPGRHGADAGATLAQTLPVSLQR